MQPSDLPPGTRLGAYRIERRLGEGGMGVVYLAEHVNLSRMVALKVLPEHLAADGEFRTRFERESRTAASLDHPHIVPVHDAGEVDGRLYIAMRFVEGKDLGKLLEEEGMLDPQRTLSLIGQTADALDEAHAAGLVHRDVKPSNIMLARARQGTGEQVFLTDFGLARQVASASRLTRSGYFMGTIAYSSPEQFLGSDLDGRTDVYSLGCVTFECLVGEPPFERPHEPAIMYAHLREPPPRPTDRRPDLASGVDEVIAIALAKGRDDRYGTCGQMVGALTAAVAGEPLPALDPSRRPTAPRAAMTPAVSDGAPTETVTRPRARPGWFRWPWLVAAVAVVAAMVAGAVWLLPSDEQQPEATGSEPGQSSPAAQSAPSPSASPTADPFNVAEGRFEGDTEQGRAINFEVRESTIVRLHLDVAHNNCMGTNGLPVVSEQFDTESGGPIESDGSFRIRLESGGVQIFEGTFTGPRKAEGTLSSRKTLDVIRPCDSGDIPWSATVRD